MNNKYGAIKTYSQLCGREFDSKAEARRGEELALLMMGGKISELRYQVPFVLCRKPSIKITIDFSYRDNGSVIYEDVKGVLTRDFRTKMAWLREQQGISVELIR